MLMVANLERLSAGKEVPVSMSVHHLFFLAAVALLLAPIAFAFATKSGTLTKRATPHGRIRNCSIDAVAKRMTDFPAHGPTGLSGHPGRWRESQRGLPGNVLRRNQLNDIPYAPHPLLEQDDAAVHMRLEVVRQFAQIRPVLPPAFGEQSHEERVVLSQQRVASQQPPRIFARQLS